MPTSTRFNSDPFALESEFDAMALTEFGVERTDLDWPLEVTRGGFFEAETKADKPVFKQARLRGAPELFGGRGLYQIFRSGKRIYAGESKEQIALRKKYCGPTDFDIWEKPSSQCTPQNVSESIETIRRAMLVKKRGLLLADSRGVVG